MRVFACKDLDGVMRVIQGESEPVDPKWFQCNGISCYLLRDSAAIPYCRDLSPGTYRELKKLDVVSGEYEFVEEVPTLKEAWEAYKSMYPDACNNDMHKQSLPQWYDLCQALDREASNPAPRYDEALIDELLEIRENVSASSGVLLRGDASKWSEPANRRAAEILQSLKRAKEGVK